MTGYRAPFRPRPGDSASVVVLKVACFLLCLFIVGAAFELAVVLEVLK